MHSKNRVPFVFAVLCLLTGILFPIVVWVFDSYRYGVELSVDGIIQLHQASMAYYYLFEVVSITLIMGGLVGFIYFKDRINELYQIIRKHVNNINRVQVFAERIGKGELDVKYEFTNEHDNLGEALVKMRDNLRKSVQDEKDRQWKMEGIAQLSDILMMRTDLSELGYDVIVYIIKRIKAVQGAFYLASENDRGKLMLGMTACYAYNRKKYMQKEFKLGEGLVGQAAIERDYIYRTEIPDTYTTITSGVLGDKKPNSLLIVPLIANETLHGVIELASLQPLSPLEIEFVNEAGKIIAQTVFNQMVNTRTAKLLDEVSKSQKRMQILLENASEIITIYEKDTTIRYVSPSVERILGYSADELTGIKDIQYIHSKGIATFEKMFSDLITNPFKTAEIQFSYTRKDGSSIWVEATGKNLLSDPAIQGIVVNTRDITIKLKAAKEEKKRGQMQALSENSLDLIIRFDRKGTFYYINPVIEKFTSKKPEYFLQKTIDDVELDKDFVALLNQIVQDVPVSKQKYNTETNLTTPSDKKIINVNAIPEFNTENEVETILVVVHDITEAKLIERQIQETNKKITESINYAERIQKAMLPQEKHLIQCFPDSFMLYEPRDVVSGDFPWIYEQDDTVYVAIVDCTGHGVPGAFMALIGNFLLNQIINSYELLSPAQILDYLHEGVKKTLKQEENTETRDGMDIGLCKINIKSKELQYAGAHRPLYIIRNTELIEIKGDKYPIGGIQYKSRKSFTNHSFSIEKGDSCFLFSDGLPDQIGGTEGKKFMTTHIKEVILNNHDKSMQEICQVMKSAYYEWKNGYKQIDDVLMLGVRVI